MVESSISIFHNSVLIRYITILTDFFITNSPIIYRKHV